MDERKGPRFPFNSRGEIQIAPPHRSINKIHKKGQPSTSSSKEIQKALDLIYEDYRARAQWWDLTLADNPAKKADKQRHVRDRLERLQEVRIHIARIEGELGIQTHPESRR